MGFGSSCWLAWLGASPNDLDAEPNMGPAGRLRLEPPPHPFRGRSPVVNSRSLPDGYRSPSRCAPKIETVTPRPATVGTPVNPVPPARFSMSI